MFLSFGLPCAEILTNCLVLFVLEVFNIGEFHEVLFSMNLNDVCVGVCIYVCVCVFEKLCVYMCIYTCISAYPCVYLCGHVCLCLCVVVNIYYTRVS